jgi:Protein of unknown function (DUF4242)
VPSYLVETYVPESRPDDARAARRRARAAANEVSLAGAHIRYVRMTFLPRDETCFHVFAADSEDAVAEACRRAGLGSPRIIPALE